MIEISRGKDEAAVNHLGKTSRWLWNTVIGTRRMSWKIKKYWTVAYEISRDGIMTNVSTIRMSAHYSDLNNIKPAPEWIHDSIVFVLSTFIT